MCSELVEQQEEEAVEARGMFVDSDFTGYIGR
jgi:hypothetical protein